MKMSMYKHKNKDSTPTSSVVAIAFVLHICVLVTFILSKGDVDVLA